MKAFAIILAVLLVGGTFLVSVWRLSSLHSAQDLDQRVDFYVQLQKQGLPEEFREIEWGTLSLEGAPILFVHFWASWCPSCLEEFKALKELFSKQPTWVFVGLSTDENLKDMRDVLEKINFPSNMIFLHDGKQKKWSTRFQVQALPETFIFLSQSLSPKFDFFQRFVGAQAWESWSPPKKSH